MDYSTIFLFSLSHLPHLLFLPQSGVWSHSCVLPKADFRTLKPRIICFFKSDKYINNMSSSHANMCPERV